MTSHRIHALVLSTLLLVSGGCNDVTSNAPEERRTPGVGAGERLLGTVTCHVDVAAGTHRCGDLVPAGGANQTRVNLNTSHFTLVTIASWYNSGTQQHTLFNAIQNDIGQDIGTHNGFNTDSIRAFVSAFNVTGGSGTITANNHTGTGTFTAANQPYWEYREIVAPGDQTMTSTWIFNVPNTVTAWNYTVGVSAPIRHPNGWVDVAGDLVIPHSGTKQHVATVYGWEGNVITSGSVSWSSTDGSGRVYVSPLDEREATVLGVLIGTAQVTASYGSATPRTRTVDVQ